MDFDGLMQSYEKTCVKYGYQCAKHRSVSATTRLPFAIDLRDNMDFDGLMQSYEKICVKYGYQCAKHRSVSART